MAHDVEGGGGVVSIPSYAMALTVKYSCMNVTHGVGAIRPSMVI